MDEGESFHVPFVFFFYLLVCDTVRVVNDNNKHFNATLTPAAVVYDGRGWENSIGKIDGPQKQPVTSRKYCADFSFLSHKHAPVQHAIIRKRSPVRFVPPRAPFTVCWRGAIESIPPKLLDPKGIYATSSSSSPLQHHRYGRREASVNRSGILSGHGEFYAGRPVPPTDETRRLQVGNKNHCYVKCRNYCTGNDTVRRRGIVEEGSNCPTEVKKQFLRVAVSGCDLNPRSKD
ncbi:hypothetical protein ZHAS_00001363 [Anopheles sinensis]|uniref:Uncharacterized protein n=1 Tax=Anopheles sinensis TaxID=74873 RepID=A0A084VB73_ANOSI|nr:hypothetical protein ZHAS_00001363 [Anopheles sinensis]